MAKKRKYVLYELIAQFLTDFCESEDYKEMFSKYQREMPPKTLYGITEQGDVEVIFSEG